MHNIMMDVINEYYISIGASSLEVFSAMNGVEADSENDFSALSDYHTVARDASRLYDSFVEMMPEEANSVFDFLQKHPALGIKTKDLFEGEDVKDFINLLDLLKNRSKEIGNVFSTIEQENIEKFSKSMVNLENRLRLIRHEVRKENEQEIYRDENRAEYILRDDPLLDFRFIQNLHRNVLSYNQLGPKLSQPKIESSLLLMLGKIKILSDKYDKFRDDNKIAALIIDVISLLSSFGLITGLVGIGQSVVKLFPNYENMDKATIQEIVRLVDVS